jgi:uroporphyrinogen decarboxylase
MSVDAIESLCTALGLDVQTDPNGMWHEGVLKRLRVDIRRPIPVYAGPELKTYADGSWDTPLGVRRKGLGYGHAQTHPLAEAVDIQQVLDYRYPSPEWYDYSGISDYCQRYSSYAFIGGSKFPLLHEACDLMGMQQLMINLFDAPELVHALLNKLLDIHMQLTQAWMEAAPESIDILLITDDYGANQNMLIGPDQWREFIKPRLQTIVEFGHQHGYKVMLHSDGAIRTIILDLIEIGFDVLNPIEPEARGMHPAGIKLDFGDQLVIHGAVSSHNLALADPDQIRAEVVNLMENVAPGGGFILCPSNHILGDMPIENVFALYDAAYEFGWY